ncbi:hypothetical protein [Salinicoccus albus]|nr:hypothetical protein [Salinicoccus albus]
MKDEAVYARTADIGSRVVDAFFNKQMALDRLFSVYEIVGQKR